MARAVPVRGLTEGAVLAAVAAVLGLAANYVPLFGAAAVFLCPLPLAVLVVRQGLKVAFLAAAVAAVIGAMVGGVLTGFSIAVGFAPSGLAMGIGIRRGLPAGSIWLLTAGAAVASVVASAGLAMLGVGMDPRQMLAEITRQSHESQQAVIQVYERLGINTAAVRQVAAQVQQMMDLLPRLLPFLFVAAGAISAYLNLVLGRPVLRRIGMRVPALPPMSAWRVPSWFLWVLPAGMLFSIVSSVALVPIRVPADTMRLLPFDDAAAVVYKGVTRYPLLEAAGMNLIVLTQMVFSLLGLIVGWVLMDKYRMPRWYRWVVILLAMSTPLFGVAALLLGLADTTFDLRRRWRRVLETRAPSDPDPVVE